MMEEERRAVKKPRTAGDDSRSPSPPPAPPRTAAGVSCSPSPVTATGGGNSGQKSSPLRRSETFPSSGKNEQFLSKLESMKRTMDWDIIKEIESTHRHCVNHFKHIRTRAFLQLFDDKEKELNDFETKARQQLSPDDFEIIQTEIKKAFEVIEEWKINETRVFEQLMDEVEKEVEKDCKKDFERLHEGWEKAKVKYLGLLEKVEFFMRSD